VKILDPDVTLSDYGLSVLSFIFSSKLYFRGKKTEAYFFLFSGLSSFWGGTYHGFFPQKTETVWGKTTWLLTLFSLAFAANCIALWLVKRILVDVPKSTWVVMSIATSLFMVHVTFQDHRFFWGVIYYAIPVLGLGLLLLFYFFKLKDSHSALGLLGVVTLVIASILQQLQVGRNWPIIDHNALYHLISFVSLILFYQFFKKGEPC